MGRAPSNYIKTKGKNKGKVDCKEYNKIESSTGKKTGKATTSCLVHDSACRINKNGRCDLV